MTLRAELSDTLDQGASIMIRYFVGGIFLAIMMLSVSGILYYKRAIKERRYLCKSLL